MLSVSAGLQSQLMLAPPRSKVQLKVRPWWSHSTWTINTSGSVRWISDCWTTFNMYSEALCNFQSLVPSVQCAIGCKCSPGCILYCLPLSIESTCNAYLCICVYFQYLLSSIHICYQQFNRDNQDPTNSGWYIYWCLLVSYLCTVWRALCLS